MKKLGITLLSVIAIFLATNNANAYGFDMNGEWECRLGWTWSTTLVEVSGYSQTYKEGHAEVGFIKVGNKKFNTLKQRPFGLPGDTPHIVLEETSNKRKKIEFHQDSSYWNYRVEGVAVVFEEKSFSEENGTKWNEDIRFCEKK